MKIAAFILSIYFLALNFSACEDNEERNYDIKTEISQNESENQQHQDLDLCSPLCNCQCCHINVVQSRFINLKFSIPYFITPSFYHRGKETDFTSSILQPPRA